MFRKLAYPSQVFHINLICRNVNIERFLLRNLKKSKFYGYDGNEIGLNSVWITIE